MEIKVDLHTHTIVSHHAYSTVRENAIAAAERGMEAIAITDHAPGMPDGAHQWHFSCQNLISRKVSGVVVLRGAECSFLNKAAELDLPEGILKTLEVVIASVHTPAYFPENTEEYTEMLLNAMNNPYIDILGHIDRVKHGTDFDLIAQEAKKHNKLIELNAHSLAYSNAKVTREFSLRLIEACKKNNTPVVINTDSHFCENIGNVKQMTDLLEEMNFDERLVMNTTLDKFLNYMKDKNKIIL